MNHTKSIVLVFVCWILVIFVLFFKKDVSYNFFSEKKINTVGLLIVATGKYIHMANRLVESAQKHFLPNHKVTYFVFTDGEPIKAPNVIKVPHQQLGWPYDTMMRFHVYYKNRHVFENMDYLFSCDADMLFVDTVGDEILSDRVAVRHSQLMFKRGFYDTNPLSTACVNRWEGNDYFVGAFYGGTQKEFLKLLKTINDTIITDLSRGVIARIHDESHLNRYFIDHEPTLILSPSYCHFENWKSPYPKKLIAFDQPEHYAHKVRKEASLSPLHYFHRMLKNGELEL